MDLSQVNSQLSVLYFEKKRKEDQLVKYRLADEPGFCYRPGFRRSSMFVADALAHADLQRVALSGPALGPNLFRADLDFWYHVLAS